VDPTPYKWDPLPFPLSHFPCFSSQRTLPASLPKLKRTLPGSLQRPIHRPPPLSRRAPRRRAPRRRAPASSSTSSSTASPRRAPRRRAPQPQEPFARAARQADLGLRGRSGGRFSASAVCSGGRLLRETTPTARDNAHCQADLGFNTPTGRDNARSSGVLRLTASTRFSASAALQQHHNHLTTLGRGHPRRRPARCILGGALLAASSAAPCSLLEVCSNFRPPVT
jgi:hypothetical protein